jgi:hypothetical protein
MDVGPAHKAFREFRCPASTSCTSHFILLLLQALKRVSEAVGMDIFELASDPEQIEAVLNAALVQGKAFNWKDLKECQKMTTKGGNVLTASWVK